MSHAVARFAVYILNEAENTSNHKARLKWAANAALRPTAIAQALAPAITIADTVETGLADVSDADLQGAVEALCAQLLFT